MPGAGESMRPCAATARNRCEDRAALRIYLEMQRSGARPSVATIVAALKFCGSAKDLRIGRMIHRDAIQGEAASNLFVATTLVHMYARCGSLGEAFQVFEGMDRGKNVVAWNCIILGCVDRGEDELALEVYGRLFSGEEQGHGGVAPNHVTFLAALKACTSLAKKKFQGKLGANENNFPGEFLRRGKEIHAWVTRLDREVHIFVANALIDMYATCRSMVDASIVFESVESPSVVSWTEMILGFADTGNEELALEFHSRMEHEGCAPDSVTFVAALKACVGLAEKEITSDRSEALHRGRILHAQAARNAQEMHVFVANALVDLYSKCGCLLLACRLFECMNRLDLVSWNSLILGYAEGGEGEIALELFARMREEGTCAPNHVTFLAALKACVCLAQNEAGTLVNGKVVKVASLSRSKAIHSLATQSTSHHDVHAFVANSLVHAYAQCGSMEDASRVFSAIQHKDQLSWSEMILGYAETGEGKLALDLYTKMKEEGGCPVNHVTILAALKACVNLAEANESNKAQCLEKGRGIHCDAATTGNEHHIFVASALVDMYARCGSLAEARVVFEKMEQRNTVSWNSLILGSTESGQADAALELYARMKQEGFTPDAITYVAVLKACGSLGALEAGRKVEVEISSVGIHEKDTMVCNSLVDFYGKCGSMPDARRVFDWIGSKRRDIVSWNALIDGYSRQGDSKQVFEAFERLCSGETPVRPNGVTFLAVLVLCSHTGLVDRAKDYFRAMVLEHGLAPDVKHFTCLVDLLGRANRLDEAVAMARSIPCEASDPLWTSILSSSWKWKNASAGAMAFQSMRNLEKSSSAFVMISDIYKTP